MDQIDQVDLNTGESYYAEDPYGGSGDVVWFIKIEGTF